MRPGSIIQPALMGVAAIFAAAPSLAKDDSWINVGRARCTFDDEPNEVNCTYSYKDIKRVTSTKVEWSRHIQRWVSDTGREVRYEAKNGIVGISNYTIGRVFDSAQNWGTAGARAVSYSPHREALRIGVPGEGYEFSTNRF